METIKTQKQGNAITLTVPQSFHIGAGVNTNPILTLNGIFYKFVDNDEFWDFDIDILKDLVKQGYQSTALVSHFKALKSDVPSALGKLIEDAEEQPIMTKSEFEKEIGL
ncbi:toxin-antitoxin system [Lentilactobacillus raoultii]|uniref:Toxin-antitoxin system n=1 Tax=Lentilactobacillus raoultii TaxID=1987503 RepID=A0ABW3PDQ6_9LACO|nr:toxin-antitoxin system [Lentilactobacillus raoultii]